MFTGIKLYAAVGLLVLLAGLASWGYIEHQRAEIADQKVLAVTKERNDLRDVVAQDEKDKKDLMAKNAALDKVNVAQRKRIEVLEDAKHQIEKQFEELARNLPSEDQACLARDLPDVIAIRLRDGPSGDNPNRAPTDPGKPPGVVPEVPA